jgi:hypothetical protein
LADFGGPAVVDHDGGEVDGPAVVDHDGGEVDGKPRVSMLARMHHGVWVDRTKRAVEGNSTFWVEGNEVRGDGEWLGRRQ